MPAFAEIAINTYILQSFTYRLPEGLDLRPGHLVRVPFRTGVEPGVVLALYDDAPPGVVGIKTIDELLHPQPVVTPEQIALARWIAQACRAPVGPCVWLWLPPGLVGQRDLLVTLTAPELAPQDKGQQDVIAVLTRRGPLRLRELERSLKSWKPGQVETTVRALALSGVVTTTPVLSPPAVRPRKIQTARLSIHPAAIPQTATHLGRNPETALHILRVLAREQTPMDVSWVYAQVPGAKLDHLKRLDALGFVELGERRTWRDSLADRDFVPVAQPALTPDQAAIWAQMQTAIAARTGAFLLHGVTGSGKTELYLRAIAAALEAGRHAVLLVPEIALTTQMIRRVAARFPGQVAVVHSRLSDGERYDTWQRARDGAFAVVVGTRSALFTPLPDVGVICIDEEHDHSYHSPATPHYDTRAVAEEMLRQRGGTLILGSATPALETYQRARETQGLMYLRLPARILGHRLRIEGQAERAGVRPRYVPAQAEAMSIDLPPVTLVDMRAELKDGNTSIFSRALSDALTQTLAARGQAILFLNRRGSATYVFCRDCGYVAACPRCDSPLTYHGAGGALRCHHCGYSGDAPQVCPTCGSARIRYFGAGTQQIEAALGQQFPAARVVRWDADTASRPELHDAILDRFLSHEADIMVGTQMVAKGFDLPLVTLVGVVSADTALALPDFRAAERTYQLLTQVAGRAGRGLLGGRVIMQTYRPEHYAIQAAARYDSEGFYARELAYRRDLGYPPYRRLARVLFTHTRGARAADEARQAAALLRARIAERNLTGTALIGPSPCFFQRVNDLYRWQLLIRAPDPALLLDTVEQARAWHVELDPVDVL